MSLSSESATTVTETPAAIPRAAGARFSSRRAYAQTFAATGAIRCLGVISGVLAARLLGPTGRGELAVVVFLPMLLVTLGELELPRSLAYEVSRFEETPRNLIATSFWLAVSLGLLQATIVVLLLPLYLPTDKVRQIKVARWFAIYLPMVSIADTLLGKDQGRGRFGRFSVFLALPGALYVAAILAARLAGYVSPAVFAAGILAGVTFTAAVRIGMDWGAISRRLPDWETAVRLLRRGLSFAVPALAGLLLCRADMFILVRLVPSTAIGLYAVAQAIAWGQVGAVNPFVQVGFSAVAGEVEPERALRTLLKHFRVAQLTVVGIGLLAIAATPWLIRFVFGAPYVGAVKTTYLLVGATAVWGMEQVLEQGLRAAGHPRLGLLSNLAGLAVLAVVGILGAAHFGINGVAAALLTAQITNLSILIAFCVFRLKIPLRLFWAFDASSARHVSGLLKEFFSGLANSRLARTQ